MTELIRTKSSGFSIENSHTLAEIEEIMKNGDIENIIIPVERVFLNYQKATVKKNHYKLLYNGNPLKYSCFHESNIDTGKKIRVYDEEEHFIGIYYWKNNLFFPDKIFYSGE